MAQGGVGKTEMAAGEISRARALAAAGTVLALACAASLMLLLFGAKPAGADKLGPPSRPFEIVSPAADSLDRGKLVRLAVRVRRGTKITSAHVDERPVALKRRGRRHLLVAKLRRRAFEPGPEAFVVHGRSARGTPSRDAVRFFIAGSRRRGLLRVRLAGTKRAGPLEVTARLAGRRARLRAQLNGHGVRPLFTRQTRIRRASLSVSDGLHYGNNLLKVVAFLNDGTYSVIKRRHHRARLAPLVGAGRDRSLRVGTGLKLNGRASRGTTPGGELSYQWRIIRRPDGSRTRLRRADTSRPGLRPDRNGTYKIKLKVRSASDGAGVASAAASDGASDTVALTVLPDTGPIGLAVDTWDTSSGAPAINLGGQLIDLPESGYELVVLNGAGAQGGTLEVLSETSIPVGQESALATQVAQQNSSSIVLIVGTPGGGPISDYSYLDAAFKAIGGQTPIGNVESGFSIIGIPGQSPGSAYQYVQPPEDFPNFAGINGYFTQDSTGAFGSAGYVFVPGQFIPYNLGPGGATPMTIGCNQQVSFCTEISPPSNPPTEGFVLALVDPYSLQQMVPQAEGYENTATDLQTLAAELQNLAPNTMVLLKSVGSPAPTTTEWFQLSRAIYGVGGNPQIFNTLNPLNGPATNDYGLVGGPGIEVSEVWGQSEGGNPFGMAGILTRSNDWAFGGAHADAFNGERTYELEQIAYQPPYQEQGAPSYNFPLQGDINDPTDPYGQAERDLAEYYYCPPDPNRTVPCNPPPPGDIRSQYWQTTHSSTQWNTSLLNGATPQPNAPYSGTQLTNLIAQLQVEMAMVNNIQLLEQGLLTPYILGGSDTNPTLQTITSQIQDAVNVPGKAVLEADLLGALEGALSLASAVLGTEAEEFAQFVQVLGALGSSLEVMEPFVVDTNGNPLLEEIALSADELGSDLWANFTETQVGYDRLVQILVSDWGKMQWANNLYLNGLDKLGDPNTVDGAINTLQLTGRRTVWRGMMNVAFHSDSTPPNPPPATLACIRNLVPDGSGVAAQIFYLSLEPLTSATVKIASEIFGNPTYAANDLNAAEDPNDFWVREWPNTAAGPCNPQ